MTNEEAIEVLNRNKPATDIRLCGVELCDAVDKAIFALKKIDELKLLMSIMTKDLKDVSMLCSLAPVKMCLENDSIVWDEEMSKQYE